MLPTKKKFKLGDIVNIPSFLVVVQKIVASKMPSAKDMRNAFPPKSISLLKPHIHKLYEKVKELEKRRQEEKGDNELSLRMALLTNDDLQSLVLIIMEKAAGRWTTLMAVPFNEELLDLLEQSYAGEASFLEAVKEKYTV